MSKLSSGLKAGVRPDPDKGFPSFFNFVVEGQLTNYVMG